MIVVDRELSDSEREALGDRLVVDLSSVSQSFGQGRQEQALWSWLEASSRLKFDGVSPFRYFELGGSSYWLHVRARIFHTLIAHARMLDRIAGVVDLDRVERVYCGSSDVDFWRWWAPDAAAIPDSKPTLTPKVSLVKFLLEELRKAPRYLRSTRRAVRRGHEAVLFTKSQFNVRIDGQLVDREFASLLDLCPEPWVRIEYHALPTVQMEARAPALRNGPRAHPTIESNAILATFLFRKPLLAPKFTVDLFRIRRRFRNAPEHSFTFPGPHGRWLALLHREIRRVGPSVGLLHLLERALEHFLRRLKPRLSLVSGENNSPGRTFVDAARRLGIPTVGIQHGDVTSTNVDYLLGATEAESALPDYFLTWGERTRDFLVQKRHYDPERTIVTGHLLADRREIEPDPTILEIRAQTTARILLFTSQPQPHVRNRLTAARQLAQFCKRHDMVCVLRLHPRELTGEIYESSFSDAGIRSSLITVEGDLYGMIAACDIGSTCYSTTAWEMMRVGKPVVIFDPFQMDLLGLRGQESVFHVDDESDGFEAWYALREGHVAEAGRLATKFFGPGDGRAAERVIDVLESIAGPICRRARSGPSE